MRDRIPGMVRIERVERVKQTFYHRQHSQFTTLQVPPAAVNVSHSDRVLKERNDRNWKRLPIDVLVETCMRDITFQCTGMY